jgi:hypothetical protein
MLWAPEKSVIYMNSEQKKKFLYRTQCQYSILARQRIEISSFLQSELARQQESFSLECFWL